MRDFHIGTWLKHTLPHQGADRHPLVRDALKEHQERTPLLEILCQQIAAWTGLPAALFLSVVIQTAWVVLGTATHRDPYPFIFMLTCSNMLQLELMFVIAIAQRSGNLLAERRAQADHEAISRILYYQQAQTELLVRIARAVGAEVDDLDSVLSALHSQGSVQGENETALV